MSFHINAGHVGSYFVRLNLRSEIPGPSGVDIFQAVILSNGAGASQREGPHSDTVCTRARTRAPGHTGVEPLSQVALHFHCRRVSSTVVSRKMLLVDFSTTDSSFPEMQFDALEQRKEILVISKTLK